MPKSKYIQEHSVFPAEAMSKGLDVGTGSMVISHSNGAVEVRHGANGAVLMQAKNVRAGTNNALWDILNNCGDIDYRAGLKVAKKAAIDDEDVKRIIIENFIDHFTSSDEERVRMKDVASDYIKDDHVNELDVYHK